MDSYKKTEQIKIVIKTPNTYQGSPASSTAPIKTKRTWGFLISLNSMFEPKIMQIDSYRVTEQL